MGGALVHGWCKAGLASQLTITARSQCTLDRFLGLYPQLTATTDNVQAVTGADIVFIAVKPWLVDEVMDQIKLPLRASNALVVSVAADVRNARINVYAMPNIAVEYGSGMTFIEELDRPSVLIDEVVRLFSLVGKVQTVPHKQMDAGMQVSGCGIAYVMRYLRAMMEGGVEMGFYPADALKISMQTMRGAVTLLEETGLHPEAAIDKVTTPGGFTIKGLNELDHAGFNSAVIRSLKAGLKKD
jgi:pyrroline-5-carboxylate reductase